MAQGSRGRGAMDVYKKEHHLSVCGFLPLTGWVTFSSVPMNYLLRSNLKELWVDAVEC